MMGAQYHRLHAIERVPEWTNTDLTPERQTVCTADGFVRSEPARQRQNAPVKIKRGKHCHVVGNLRHG